MIRVNRLGLLVAMTLLVLFLASLPQTASAARGVRISPGEVISQGSSLRVTFNAGETSIECSLTLTGFMNTALTRITALTPIGTITRVNWNTCIGGEIEAFLFLPREIGLTAVLEEPRFCVRARAPSEAPYNTACGALLTILGLQFRLSVFGGFARCLYGSPTERVGVLLPLTRTSSNEREASYTMGALTLLANSLRLLSGFGCPATGELRGRFNEPLSRQTLTLLA